MSLVYNSRPVRPASDPIVTSSQGKYDASSRGKFSVGDCVAPGWAAGANRRGTVAQVLGKNWFQVKWTDGTTGRVRGDQLVLVGLAAAFDSAPEKVLGESLHVGSHIQIQSGSFSVRRQYLSGATGKIIAVLGSKASVLLDEPNNKAYKPHTVRVEKCLLKLICAAGWERDSRSQELSPEGFSLPDCVKLTNSAATDCAIASVESPSTQTCENSGLKEAQQTSSRRRHRASHSPLKASGLAAKTKETVSPPSCDKSEGASPNSSAWKTCLDCYQPPLFPETNPAHIFGRCSGNFTAVGTMQNGLLSELPSLEPPGLVNDYCWLPRPGALSWTGNGRPPGTTKSEAQAKKLGILQKNEVFNPDWLEPQFGLPVGWTSPQECRAATELLAPAEQHLVTVLTLDSQLLPSGGSCTCPNCHEPLNRLEDGCGACGWVGEKKATAKFPLEPKRKASGSLYPYIKNKKLKSGLVASYPLVEGRRDPDKIEHWYWAYCYEEKVEGKWKNRSMPVPQFRVATVRTAIDGGMGVSEIKALIKGGFSK